MMSSPEYIAHERCGCTRRLDILHHRHYQSLGNESLADRHGGR